MKMTRDWLKKATDQDLITMHDNVEAQIDELMIGMLDDTDNPMPATKLSSLELEIDVIKGEIALRQIEAKKPVIAVEVKTATIIPFPIKKVKTSETQEQPGPQARA